MSASIFRAALVLLLSIQSAALVSAAEVTIALPTKSFQQIIFPLAQERGFMKDEGIDLKITFMEPTPSIQAMMATAYSSPVPAAVHWWRLPAATFPLRLFWLSTTGSINGYSRGPTLPA